MTSLCSILAAVARRFLVSDTSARCLVIASEAASLHLAPISDFSLANSSLLHAKQYRQNKATRPSYQLEILLTFTPLPAQITLNQLSLAVVSGRRMGCPPHGYSVQLNSLLKKLKRIFVCKYGYFHRCSSYQAIVKTLPIPDRVVASC